MDTTASGAGVEVFQPFEVAEGQLTLINQTGVTDGDQALTILITDLQPAARVGFTIDVDDTLENSALGNIQVTDSEMSGGIVRLYDGSQDESQEGSQDESQAEATAMFDTDATATLTLACPSF